MVSKARLVNVATVALAGLVMAGCAHQQRVVTSPPPVNAPQYGYNTGYGNAPPANSGYNAGYYGQGQQQQFHQGRVQSIEPVRAENRTSGGGALIGGAVGGLIGHQVDHGARKDAATLVGVVAGALIGNQIEKNNAGVQDYYRVNIRLDNGEVRAYNYAQLNDIHVGDRVRIDANNQVYRN